MAQFITSVQHKRGTTAALNSEANASLTFKAGELILEDIGSGAGEWKCSNNSTKYLARIGTGSNFASAACLWAHAVDVPVWLKTNVAPDGLGDGTITTILNSHSTSISDLKTALGAGGSVSKQISDAIALLDYTSTDSDPLHVVTSVSQTDGKISIVKTAITESMLDGVGYADLKSAVGTKNDTSDKDTAFGRIAALTKTVNDNKTGLETRVVSLETTVNGKAPSTEGGDDGVVGLVEKTTALRTDLGTKTGTGTAFEQIAGLTSDLGELSQTVSTHDTDINDSTTGLKVKTTALRTDLGTKTDSKDTATAFGKIAKNADDISTLKTTTGNLTSELNGVKTILGAPASGDTAATGLVKEVADLKESIGDLTNVMNFRGTVESLPTSTAGYNSGDVIAVTKGDDAGKEFVLDNGTWVEFGNSTATSSAISNLTKDLGTLTNRVTTVEEIVGDSSSPAIESDDKFATGTLYAKAAYTESKATAIRTDLGAKTDGSTVDSAFGRIAKLEGMIGLDPDSGETKGLTERVIDLESGLGKSTETGTTGSDAFSKIRKNAADISTINTKLTNDLGTNTSDKTAFEQISALDTRVSDNESDIESLQTAVGDEKSGLLADVAKLKTDLGDIGGTSTVGTDAFSKIRKNAADIGTNTSNITTIMNHLANGWFTKDVNNNLVWYAGLETTNPTAISIDCGEIV